MPFEINRKLDMLDGDLLARLRMFSLVDRAVGSFSDERIELVTLLQT
jgi:hypothetical protein